MTIMAGGETLRLQEWELIDRYGNILGQDQGPEIGQPVSPEEWEQTLVEAKQLFGSNIDLHKYTEFDGLPQSAVVESFRMNVGILEEASRRLWSARNGRRLPTGVDVLQPTMATVDKELLPYQKQIFEELKSGEKCIDGVPQNFSIDESDPRYEAALKMGSEMAKYGRIRVAEALANGRTLYAKSTTKRGALEYAERVAPLQAIQFHYPEAKYIQNQTTKQQGQTVRTWSTGPAEGSKSRVVTGAKKVVVATALAGTLAGVTLPAAAAVEHEPSRGTASQSTNQSPRSAKEAIDKLLGSTSGTESSVPVEAPQPSVEQITGEFAAETVPAELVAPDLSLITGTSVSESTPVEMPEPDLEKITGEPASDVQPATVTITESDLSKITGKPAAESNPVEMPEPDLDQITGEPASDVEPATETTSADEAGVGSDTLTTTPASYTPPVPDGAEAASPEAGAALIQEVETHVNNRRSSLPHKVQEVVQAIEEQTGSIEAGVDPIRAQSIEQLAKLSIANNPFAIDALTAPGVDEVYGFNADAAQGEDGTPLSPEQWKATQVAVLALGELGASAEVEGPAVELLPNTEGQAEVVPIPNNDQTPPVGELSPPNSVPVEPNETVTMPAQPDTPITVAPPIESAITPEGHTVKSLDDLRPEWKFTVMSIQGALDSGNLRAIGFLDPEEADKPAIAITDDMKNKLAEYQQLFDGVITGDAETIAMFDEERISSYRELLNAQINEIHVIQEPNGYTPWSDEQQLAFLATYIELGEYVADQTNAVDLPASAAEQTPSAESEYVVSTQDDLRPEFKFAFDRITNGLQSGDLRDMLAPESREQYKDKIALSDEARNKIEDYQKLIAGIIAGDPEQIARAKAIGVELTDAELQSMAETHFLSAEAEDAWGAEQEIAFMTAFKGLGDVLVQNLPQQEAPNYEDDSTDGDIYERMSKMGTYEFKNASGEVIRKADWKNVSRVIEFYVDKGYTFDQAIGFAANCIAESGCDPKANQDGGPAYGIFQWEGSRKNELLRIDNHDNLKVQLDYSYHELKTTESRANRLIKATDSAKEAAKVVCSEFERPGVPHMDVRVGIAGDLKDVQKNLKEKSRQNDNNNSSRSSESGGSIKERASRYADELGIDKSDIDISESGFVQFHIDKKAALEAFNLGDYNGYPSNKIGLPKEERDDADPNGMYWGECVSWVMWRVDRDNKPGEAPAWAGTKGDQGKYGVYGGGNANGWVENAKAEGIRADDKPAEGAVLVSTLGEYGHVMYVEKVLSDGSVAVSQMNEGGGGNWTAEVIPIEQLEHGKLDKHLTFVHLEEGKGPTQ